MEALSLSLSLTLSHTHTHAASKIQVVTFFCLPVLVGYIKKTVGMMPPVETPSAQPNPSRRHFDGAQESALVYSLRDVLLDASFRSNIRVLQACTLNTVLAKKPSEHHLQTYLAVLDSCWTHSILATLSATSQRTAQSPPNFSVVFFNNGEKNDPGRH